MNAKQIVKDARELSYSAGAEESFAIIEAVLDTLQEYKVGESYYYLIHADELLDAISDAMFSGVLAYAADHKEKTVQTRNVYTV